LAKDRSPADNLPRFTLLTSRAVVKFASRPVVFFQTADDLLYILLFARYYRAFLASRAAAGFSSPGWENLLSFAGTIHEREP